MQVLPHRQETVMRGRPAPKYPSVSAANATGTAVLGGTIPLQNFSTMRGFSSRILATSGLAFARFARSLSCVASDAGDEFRRSPCAW